MKKKATLQVTFTFDWTIAEELNPLADPSHYAEMYIYSVLRDSGVKGVDVEYIGMEDVK